jgi:hypothetical protein
LHSQRFLGFPTAEVTKGIVLKLKPLERFNLDHPLTALSELEAREKIEPLHSQQFLDFLRQKFFSTRSIVLKLKLLERFCLDYPSLPFRVGGICGIQTPASSQVFPLFLAAEGLLDGSIVLKLKPLGLLYLDSRFTALSELEALRADAPVDYFRAVVAELGDYRKLEKLRAFLKMLERVKVSPFARRSALFLFRSVQFVSFLVNPLGL